MQLSIPHPFLQSEAEIRFGNQYKYSVQEQKDIIIKNIFNEIGLVLNYSSNKNEIENEIAVKFRSIKLRLCVLELLK